MDKNLFPPTGGGSLCAGAPQADTVLGQGKRSNTCKGLLNTVSLLSNISSLRSQEQAGRSIHAYEVDYVLSKCHMLSMTLKKSVSPNTLLSITAIQTMVSQ